MLTGCIISYNDYPLIKKCVESIIDQVDRLIIVDGRYRDFPGSSMTSTGDTKEYLNEINGGKVQVIYAGNLPIWEMLLNTKTEDKPVEDTVAESHESDEKEKLFRLVFDSNIE